MDGDERNLTFTDYERSREDGSPGPGEHAPSSLGFVVTQARPGTSAPPARLYLFGNTGHGQVPCANPKCENGGLDPRPLIRELMEEHPDELRVVACEGREKQKSGGGRGTRCDTMFCIRFLEDVRRTVKTQT